MSGYHNPLALANITARSRVDEGVDYGVDGGWLIAIADCHIQYSTYTPPGWPGGYVSYTISEPGPLLGAVVYYAEGVTDLPSDIGGYRAGGWKICALDSGGSIEIGYGSNNPPNAYARQMGGSYDGVNSQRAGVAFNDLIVALGGPGGNVEGIPQGPGVPYNITGISPGGATSGGGGPVGFPPVPPVADYDYWDLIRESWYVFGQHGYRAYNNANTTRDRMNRIHYCTTKGPV